MKEKYISIEEYFANKEQLLRYKTNSLRKGEIIYLTNNQEGYYSLNINISKFNDCKIVIQNSNFRSLNISNNKNSKVDVSIEICNIEDFAASTINQINLDNCHISKSSIIFAKYILINELKTECKMFLGDKNTKIVTIKNTESLDQNQLFDVEGEYIHAFNVKSLFKCKGLNSVFLSSLTTKIDSIETKCLTLSNCYFKYDENLVKDRIHSSVINILGENYIIGQKINCDKLFIKQNSGLYFGGADLVSNNITLENGSKIISSQVDTSTLNAGIIKLYPNTYINIDNIVRTNENTHSEYINQKQLNNERQELTRVLKLALNKNNKPMKVVK